MLLFSLRPEVATGLWFPAVWWKNQTMIDTTPTLVTSETTEVPTMKFRLLQKGFRRCVSHNAMQKSFHEMTVSPQTNSVTEHTFQFTCGIIQIHLNINPFSLPTVQFYREYGSLRENCMSQISHSYWDDPLNGIRSSTFNCSCTSESRAAGKFSRTLIIHTYFPPKSLFIGLHRGVPNNVRESLGTPRWSNRKPLKRIVAPFTVKSPLGAICLAAAVAFSGWTEEPLWISWLNYVLSKSS